MEKPRKVYWAKRNGVPALVLWRVAVPEYIAVIAMALVAVSIFAGVVVGLAFHIWWMALPGLSIGVAVLLRLVWMILRLIVLDFINVNRKDL